MALAAGDVVKFTLFQNADTVLNVFHYRNVDFVAGGDDYAGLAGDFWNLIKAPFRAWIPSAYTDWFDRIVVENVTNEIDFGVYTITGTERNGARVIAGDFNPLWLAAPIRLNVGTRLTRPGQKRISGLVESDVSNGTILPTPLALLQTLGDSFAALLDPPVWASVTFEPVVYGEIIPPTVNDPVGRPAPVSNPVVSATAVSYMTSQRSRRN